MNRPKDSNKIVGPVTAVEGVALSFFVHSQEKCQLYLSQFIISSLKYFVQNIFSTVLEPQTVIETSISYIAIKSLSFTSKRIQNRPNYDIRTVYPQ